MVADVLVTGGTGAIGPRVVEALQAAGKSVRVLMRCPTPTGLPADVELHYGDITNRDAVAAAVNGVSGVVHLAALLHLDFPSPQQCAEFRRINVDGTACVVDAACKAGVSRLVLASTIAVYGHRRFGETLHEDMPPSPDTVYGDTKLAAERVALDGYRADGERLATVLRLAAVYGTRVSGNYRRLLMGLARKRFVPLGAGSNRRSLVYDRDAARAFTLALDHKAAAGAVFNVSDGTPWPMRQIIEAICEALGRPVPRWRLPVAPVRTAAGLVDVLARLAGRTSTFGRATIDKYCEDVVISSARIQTELGFAPQYDLTAGWREAVGELKRGGAL